jgi:hypothetical protein
VLARQVFYHLSYTCVPLLPCFQVLYFLPGLASDCVPPTYASGIAGIIECTTTPSLFLEIGSY